jgi:hypothetical protein
MALLHPSTEEMSVTLSHSLTLRGHNSNHLRLNSFVHMLFLNMPQTGFNSGNRRLDYKARAPQPRLRMLIRSLSVSSALVASSSGRMRRDAQLDTRTARSNVSVACPVFGASRFPNVGWIACSPRLLIHSDSMFPRAPMIWPGDGRGKLWIA